MAEAVQDLFPGTQVTIGPAIENGFYYDFFRNEPFSTDDLARIEARMAEIVKADQPFVREEVEPRRGARALRAHGRALQARAARRHPRGRAGHALPPGRLVRPVPRPARPVDRPDRRLQADQGGRRLLARRRQQPAAAADLRHGVRHRRPSSTPTCTSSRRRSGATIAGSAARWTCSTSRKRRRARSSGTRKGWTLWRAVENYIRRRLDGAGYVEVKTPQLVDQVLWERSGHWRQVRRATCSRSRPRSGTSR